MNAVQKIKGVDFYLSEFQVHEDEEKIIFHLPLNMLFSTGGENRKYLLRFFSEVTIVTKPNINHRIVTCYKYQLL